MKVISMIYQRVRHHLNDDWVYGVGKCSATKFTFKFISHTRCMMLNLWNRLNIAQYDLSNPKMKYF